MKKLILILLALNLTACLQQGGAADSTSIDAAPRLDGGDYPNRWRVNSNCTAKDSATCVSVIQSGPPASCTNTPPLQDDQGRWLGPIAIEYFPDESRISWPENPWISSTLTYDGVNTIQDSRGHQYQIEFIDGEYAWITWIPGCVSLLERMLPGVFY